MEKIGFSTDLLSWYFKNERILPWRENSDPYRIWLSEIMLQQTQVATVIDYFNRFTAVYPTVKALAEASEDDVFKLWEGLGYYSRARNLLRCAKTIMADYEGQFPTDLKAVLKLPGIGPYTAGAILSIAYNLPVPAVDGNVMRVMSRLYASDLDIALPKTRLFIEQLVMANLPEDRRHFNQALMELGALVCTPKQPKCEHCPVKRHCQALSEDRVQLLPVKINKLKRTIHLAPVALIAYENDVLLVKKNDTGLLSGLWGFPSVELPPEVDPTGDPEAEWTALRHWALENLDLALSDKPVFLGEAQHVFTHKTWHLRLWAFQSSRKVHTDLPQIQWTEPTALKDFALSTAMKKLIKYLK